VPLRGKGPDQASGFDAVVDDEAAPSFLSDDEEQDGRPRASSTSPVTHHSEHRCRSPLRGRQVSYAAVVELATEKKVQPQAPAFTEWAMPAGM
jgi:hypothetical protein